MSSLYDLILSGFVEEHRQELKGCSEVLGIDMTASVCQCLELGLHELITRACEAAERLE